MTIAMQDGAVLLDGDAATCECCESELDISLGTEADCDCFYLKTEENPAGVPRPCFTILNPAPETVVLNGVEQSNLYYPLGYYGGQFAVQIPWDFTTSPQPGWKTFVARPTNVRLSGNVGGDVVINAVRVVGSDRYEGSPPEATAFTLIPNENEFPCGECGKNGGAHPFSADFVMYPFTTYLVSIRTYLTSAGGTTICSPWLRATIERLGAVAP